MNQEEYFERNKRAAKYIARKEAARKQRSVRKLWTIVGILFVALIISIRIID